MPTTSRAGRRWYCRPVGSVADAVAKENQQRSASGLLISNVQVTYLRMLVTIFFGLVTTKLVFRELGEIAFGLFSVLGASVFIVSTIETTLTASTQRHLAIEIGRDDTDEARRIFSTSILLTLAIAAGVLVVGMAVAPWIVSWLQVPADRFAACVQVLRLTILTAGIAVATAPFTAVIAAKQNFTFLAVVATLISFSSLVGALTLAVLPGDPLVNYALIRSIVVGGGGLVKAGFCYAKFAESRFRVALASRRLLSPLLSYGGWAGVGAFGWHTRVHGFQLLGNVFFGPSFNAGLGIAQQVNGYTGTLPSTIVRVTTPMMTQMYGRDDSRRLGLLRDASTKACILLTALLAGPMLIEMEYVFQVWLDAPPVLASVFTTLILANLLVDHSAAGYGIMFTATGRIRGYAIFTFVNVIVQLVAASAIAGATDWPPASMLLVVVLGTAANQIFRVCYSAEAVPSRALFHWLREISLPAAFVLVASLTAGLLVTATMTEGWIRLGCVVIVHSAVLLMSSWRFVASTEERALLRNHSQPVVSAAVRRLSALVK